MLTHTFHFFVVPEKVADSSDTTNYYHCSSTGTLSASPSPPPATSSNPTPCGTLTVNVMKCLAAPSVLSSVPHDSVFMLNPGFSHPNLREKWEPTLSYLRSIYLKASSPSLIFRSTYNSHSDGSSDLEYLASFFCKSSNFRVNHLGHNVLRELISHTNENGEQVSANLGIIEVEGGVKEATVT